MANSLENALLKCVTYVQKMCVKRPQLENWFWKRLNNRLKKKKILLDWASSVTRSLCKFSFKTFSITETKENKARVSGNRWRLKFQRRRSHSCFLRNVGWHNFWLHLNEHGLHSSQENTGGCSSLYACWRNRETQMGGERGDGGKGSEERALWNKTWLG